MPVATQNCHARGQPIGQCRRKVRNSATSTAPISAGSDGPLRHAAERNRDRPIARDVVTLG